MLVERIRYSLMDRIGRSFREDEDEEKERKELNNLQLAFEHLAYSQAYKYTEAGKIAGDKDKECWETLEQTLNLTPVCARLLFKIAYQCPQRFRIAHLSQTSRTAYLKQLKILIKKDLIMEKTDFYGDFYLLSLKFMRAIAFGKKWREPFQWTTGFINEDDEEF